MRPTSLKGLIPHLGKSLGITPAAIYERQRALVRVGLLRARPGRGPGSGVPADAKSVATLLISILATGSLSEVEDQTKAVASLKSANGRCKITGKRTFGAALAATLASDALRSRALYASVRRSGKGAMASIVFLKEPIDFYRDKPVDKISDHADHSWFGLTHHDFYLEDFAHLTIEATINLWAALHEAELGASR